MANPHKVDDMALVGCCPDALTELRDVLLDDSNVSDRRSAGYFWSFSRGISNIFSEVVCGSSSKELEQLTYRQIFKPQTSATLKSLADSQRTCYPEQISYLKLKSTTAVRWKLV